MKTKAQLIIQTAFLGDLILSIPWISRLREISGQSKLILVCKKGLGEYFLKEKIVDHVYEVIKGDRSSYQNIIRSINMKFDIENLFCVHRSTRSLLFANQILAERKIGFSSFLGFWIFDDTVEYESTWPDPLRQWNLLSVVDQKSEQLLQQRDWSYLNIKNKNSSLPIVPDFFQFSKKDNHLQTQNKIAFFPGSVWATKKWTESGFIELGQQLQKKGFQIDVMGGPDEKELCQKISDQIPASKNLAGQLSLTDSIYHIRMCRVVVANDSAPTHMAACENIPVITLFGPTTLSLGFRPWQQNSRIAEIDLNCRPCGKHGHNQCPLGHHRCMKDISVASVLNLCEELINQ